MKILIKTTAGLIMCMAAAHGAERSVSPEMKRATKVEPILVDTAVTQSGQNCALALRYQVPPPQSGIYSEISTVLINQPCSKLALARLVVNSSDGVALSAEAKAMRFEQAEALAKKFSD